MRYEPEFFAALTKERKAMIERRRLERERLERIREAAPDLLEACKIQLAKITGDPLLLDMLQKDETCLQVLKRAIAKAEGS